jgi:hypothetical protein
MENLFGKMAGLIKGNGLMENNLAKVSTLMHKAFNNMDVGSLAREYNGSKKSSIIQMSLKLKNNKVSINNEN